MKVICARKDFYEGVQVAARAVSARTSLPILGHVLITAEEDKLRIAATDLELGMESVVAASVQEQGSLTAPARVLTEVLASLPETDVVLSVDDSNTVGLKCATSDFSILGLPPEEFPTLPDVREEVRLKIDREVLREGIKRTSFAVSVDESRAILTGVLMQVSESGLKLIATDTHRACVQECAVVEVEGSMNAIVPGRAMVELSRIIPEEEGTVEATFSANQVKFQVDDLVLISRLIEGQFPNVERVIPSEFTKKLTIPTDQFLQSIKRVAIVARENSNRTILQTVNGTLIATAESGSVGKAHEEVEVIREGDDIKMAFNSRYLLDMLGVVETEAIEVELSGEVNPAVLRPQGKNDYTYVLMPMQVS